MSQYTLPWKPKRPTKMGFVSGMLVSAGQLVKASAGPLIARIPGMILIGAIVTVCVVVWLHAILFGFVDRNILQPANTAQAYLLTVPGLADQMDEMTAGQDGGASLEQVTAMAGTIADEARRHGLFTVASTASQIARLDAAALANDDQRLSGLIDRLRAHSDEISLAQEVKLASPSTWGLTPTAIRRMLASSGSAGADFTLLGFLLWPLQFGFVRDLVGLGALAGLFNLVPAYTIWWERKVAGRIQSRVGPMRVGGWHGWAQSIADGIKLINKEDFVPTGADGPLFRIAPYFAVIPSLLAFVALPFGITYVFRELDIAVVFIMAMLGVEVFAVILAGWASNNKWSVYGAMREACQMVSYEIPLGLALLIPVVCVGSLSLREIGQAQDGGWFTWLAFSNPFCFAAFICYFIASLASCKRAPFDLPESESELVAGFLTEYSGLRWALFFLAEYSAMFVVAALAALLFLGGWNSIFPASWGEMLPQGILGDGLRGLLLGGPIWLILKTMFMLYVQIWVRWTLPRIRIDQVLYACVQVLLPVTMFLLLGATLWTWAGTSDSASWQVFATIVNWICGLIGMVFALGFPAIAAYGFYHRRRLVGNLVVDVMPGS
ncbi:MAG: NADH-quinone oxidoreductase subunit NuoH [Planctomycetota bacterium]